ncbi:uncharacterized protein LOC129595973 [Paramacrobiotus metropolitanus]|uniref:uncharacterized protein LOC129595973 n=1 Tax=Paramacrobiotus metropolitanus TaxID=2943436 RepID=UPI002446570C|nr:uncharacterized protein LOC129595973 [Paramacrobiotus metropolitanus]
MAAYGLALGEAQSTAPRHSYDAQDVILCVGGCEHDSADFTAPVTSSVYAFSPSIPAVWRLKDLPTDGEGCRSVLLDAASILVSHHHGMHIIRRGSRYVSLRDEWRVVEPTPRRGATLASLNGSIFTSPVAMMTAH